MNSWLAQVYGTNGATSGGDDLEKVAQSMLLQKMAEAEGVDISGLNQDQLGALAAEVFPGEGEEGGEVVEEQPGVGAAPAKQAGEPASETGEEVQETEEVQDLAKEAQAKFEEADFLGRVMAHSFNNEMDKIASARGEGQVKTAGAVGAALNKLRGGASSAASAAKSHAGRAAGAVKEHAGRAANFAKSHKGHIGAAAGGAAAGGAAGYAAGHSKEASILIEKLATIKAAEILEANGIDPTTGQPLPGSEAATAPAQGAAAGGQQAASPEQQVDQAVNERAVEILKEAGYRLE